MTRHSRNCTASSVYSYNEKKKDAKASGYGSFEERFSKDAVKDFDCCCLTLHPCRNPVVTPEGFLYDKEAVLEYIVTKKSEIAKKLKEYERQCKRELDSEEDEDSQKQKSGAQKFLKMESGTGVPTKISIAGSSHPQKKHESHTPSTSSVSNMVEGREKTLPSFWIPALTPDSKKCKIQKPDKTVRCPMSNRPLKMKDLIPVKFTVADDPDDKRSLEVKRERYRCPVTGDILGNQIPVAVLRPTGDIVTMQCVELIKKDMKHPLTGEDLKESDIIPLQRGGTGYSRVNYNLVAKKERPVLQA